MEKYDIEYDDGPVNNVKPSSKKSKDANKQKKKKTKKNTGNNKVYTSKHVRKVERQFEKLNSP